MGILLWRPRTNPRYLLFGAAKLGLRIIELPIRYRERVYGQTQISRFQHGWMLLKMTWWGLRHLRWR